MDILKGKDSCDTIMPACLYHLDINGQVIWAVRCGYIKECASEEPLLPVTIPAPICIRIGITPGALTVVDAFRAAVAGLNPIMTCAGIKRRPVESNGQIADITQYAHGNRCIYN